MAQAACSDEDFIRVWGEHKSAVGVAGALGVNERTVHSRRRRIERTRGIRLLASSPKSPDFLITNDRVEVQITLDTGIILVAGDLHFRPGIVPVMHRAMCYLAKKLKPYAIIWNGDVADFPQISRFPSIGWESYPQVSKELEAINDRSKELMDSAPSAKRIWTAGNHDLRFESRLANVAGEYKDVKGIHLKDHFPEWTPAWFCTVNQGTESHTEIRHREKGGIHASYRNTLEAGVSIVTGHDHVADVKPYTDRRGRRYGVRHGMSMDSARDPQTVNYLEGRTPNWQAALAVLHYRNGTLLYPELALREDDEHFQFRGEFIRV